MTTAFEAFLPRVDALIRVGSSAVAAEDPQSFHEFRSGSLSLLLQLYGSQHPNYRDFDARVLSAFRGEDIQAGLGILQAVKRDIEEGWLFTAKGLVSAELFSDYLAMASYLQEEGYKDAAAVIAGSTLESHLRQLCLKNSIPIDSTAAGKTRRRKADALNSDLASGGVYGKLDHKNVTAWLDLRNNAAHGNYGAYTSEQVQLMIGSVSDFISRTPL